MSKESNDSVCRELDRAYEQHKGDLVASRANQATEAGQLINTFRDQLNGAIRLTLDLGLASGHAETYEELYTEVRSQIEEYRTLAILAKQLEGDTARYHKVLTDIIEQLKGKDYAAPSPARIRNMAECALDPELHKINPLRA